MRKTLLIAALCVLAVTSHAQTPIKAGTVQLGGAINYSQQTSDSPYAYSIGGGAYNTTTQHYTNKQLFLNPSAGYFVADNLAVGVSFARILTTNSYTYDISGYANPSEQRFKQTVLGAFVQYYRMFTDHFGVTGTLNGGYTHSVENYTYGNPNTNTSNGFSAGLTPSVVFFPVPKFAVGASAGSLRYSHSTGKQEGINTIPGTSTYSSFAAAFGLSNLAFSGTYYFGR